MIDITSKYGEDIEIKFNPEKTQLMQFNNHKRIKLNNCKPITMNGKCIEIVENMKYLGF